MPLPDCPPRSHVPRPPRSARAPKQDGVPGQARCETPRGRRRDANGLSGNSQAAHRLRSRWTTIVMPKMADTPTAHRVLVVDDEPNLVEVVSMALRFQGFTVETAATGREALAAVSTFKPHLMVLDVMLPDMEGFDVAAR